MAWQVKKDDLVEVVAGKEIGKRGKVLRVAQDKNRVVVENLMMVKRHTRPGTHS
ncbi:MAG: 50S ribosomal protein L24, partial [bacterium]